MKDDTVDTRTAAAFLGVTHKALSNMRDENRGPLYTKRGTTPQSRVRYSLAELERWKARQRGRRRP